MTENAASPVSDRPCRYCRAAWGNDPELCEFAHHNTPGLVELATAMARLFQSRTPSDEQIGWFMEDAEAVVGDFDPPPDKWRLRKLPNSSDQFVARFRINDVTYVIEDGEGHIPPVRLSTLRQWEREADLAARNAS
jgi:hypothetical protein